MAGLRLRIDPSGVVSGERVVRSAMDRVKNSARGAKSAVDSLALGFVNVGNRVGGASARLSGITSVFRNMRNQVQNVAFQVGDFFTQVGAGTAASVALGQQLPQLLGGFGALGAVLGAVVAIAVPFGGALLGLENNSKSLKESMDELSDAVSRYSELSDQANVSSEKLRETYGRLGQSAQNIITNLEELARVEAINKLETALGGLSETFGSIDASTELTGSLRDYGAIVRTTSDLTNTIAGMREEFDLTTQEADALGDAIAAIGNSSGVDEQVDAAAVLFQTLLGVFGTVENIPPELRQVAEGASNAALEAAKMEEALGDGDTAAKAILSSILSLPTAISAAQGTAQGLADVLSDAARNALATMQAMAQARIDKNAATQEDAAQFHLSRRFADEDFLFSQEVDPVGGRKPTKPIKKRKTRGGSAVSEEAKKVREAKDAYESLVSQLDDAKAASIEYEEAKQTLIEAEARGVITTEESARVLALAKERYEEAAQGSNKFRDSLKEGLADALTDIKDLDGALEALGRRLISLAANSAADSLFGGLFKGLGEGGFLSSIFGSAKGNVFNGGNVVPFARGGVVSEPTLFPMKGNNTGLMGEAGAEAILPLRRGPGGRLGVENNGGGVVRVVIEQSPSFVSTVRSEAQGVAIETTKRGIEEFSTTVLPDRIESYEQDRRRRGR